MPIIVRLDVMLAKRKMTSKDLAERIGISEQNLSILRSGKARGVRFGTLEKICEALDCQPGDLLEFEDPTSPSPTTPEHSYVKNALGAHIFNTYIKRIGSFLFQGTKFGQLPLIFRRRSTAMLSWH